MLKDVHAFNLETKTWRGPLAVQQVQLLILHLGCSNDLHQPTNPMTHDMCRMIE
jgi:hypothetical protein